MLIFEINQLWFNFLRHLGRWETKVRHSILPKQGSASVIG